MFYWVAQELRGVTYMHGPYKTEGGRDHRYDLVSGGEIHKFDSFSDEKEVVRGEFNDARVRKL